MTDAWHETRSTHRSQQADSIANSALSLIIQHGAPGLTMAAIAKAADISRQTLYRYYEDVDAVLVGVAELIASHDEEFERLVAEQLNPTARLDLMARAIAGSGHGPEQASALHTVLPPQGRDVLAKHEARIHRLLAEVLRSGMDDGSFDNNLDPSADAPLILGLLTAADPGNPERAVQLVHHLTANQPKEQPQ